MSYNQSRSDRSEPQYRRTGRSAGNHHQQQPHHNHHQQQQHNRSGAGAGYGRGGEGTDRSFKKPINAQGGQSRVNLPPVNHSVSNNHNGPTAHSRSQGASGESVVGGTANQTESVTRNSGPIPKAPTSKSTTMNSKETDKTSNASGDASPAFPLQFGSLGPDMNTLLKIPARTSSAPPNMDEQKRAQVVKMQQASLKTTPNLPASVPKKDIPSKTADNQLVGKEGHNPSSEKADIQVPHISPPSQTQKPPITNIRMPSVQTPYPHAQVPHPVHFGNPNMHIQPPVTAPQFQMPMPMPMPLSMGNPPQMQQQMFFPGLPSNSMHHQGMIHQAPGHGFATSMGPQIHSQLGHVGVGLGPQFPQQQVGKFGGARKTTPVKITHPDTHEELRLDRRGDPYPEGESVAPKQHSNPRPRSQTIAPFPLQPVNLGHPSYNSSTMIYPQASIPLNTGPMSSTQPPRFNFPVIDGSQRVQIMNQSAHTAPPLIRPVAPTHVSVKPATASEKIGSPKARSPVEVNLPSQKDVEAGSFTSSRQSKSDAVPAELTSSAPPAKSALETAPVARGEMVNESNSTENQTCKVESPRNLTENLGRGEMVKESISNENQTSKMESPHDMTEDRGSGEKVDESISIEKQTCKVESPRKLTEDIGKGEMVNESISIENQTSKVEPPQNSTEDLGQTVPDSLVSDLGDNLTSAPATLSKDKSAVESTTRRNTSSKGKKKIKEILQKADAAGTTSDLYNAYKGPDEKKETKLSSEISNVVPNVSNQKLASTIPQAVDVATVVAEPVKNEPEDWEDAADVSTPKLETADNSVNAKKGSSDEAQDSCSNTEKKYSRDFLLKFADLCTTLPEGFEVSPDIATTLILTYMGASHYEHDSYPTSGKVMDRQPSGARLDRRPSNMGVEDRWMKNQGLPVNYGGNVGFRPGQGGNSGVLRNPRPQGAIMNRPMQHMGPMGGMGRPNPDLERWQRPFQQKGLFPSPHTPMQVMHKAERKYQVGTVTDEEQAKQRQLKGILNKLTPQNFEKLFEQVKSVNIDNAVTLSGVISQIFDKALMEPTFCEMYADFCVHLSGALPDFSENGEKITFKRLLLNKCQEEFERGEKEEEEASRVAEEGQAEQTEEEREEKRLKVRRRMLGNIRLIGELYKKRMLTEKIMHACIQKLLLLGHDQDPHQDPHEENIEALCKLMSTIGVMIDHQKTKMVMDAYFERMRMLSCKQELSSRVRFMLINAIDLRKNKWQERMKVEGPKKIEEVHRDAAQERQTQANRLSRGPSMNSSARRGHMEFSPRGGGGMLSPPGAQMGGYHGPPQGRGYGNQDIRYDERPSYEPRMVPMPQRSVPEGPITLGPQGGLGQGMSMRRPAVVPNPMQFDATQAGAGDSRRPAGNLNGFGSQRPSSPANHGRSSPQERGAAYVHREFARTSDPSSEGSSARQQVPQSPSSTVNSPRENALSEERLREMSVSAIREYYSARDEKEIGLCMKDMNSPSYHPTMISHWVTDSFERKDKERDLLAKLLVNLVKSPENTLTEVQLVKGFESVLTTLEDAVNDAPKAAEFLGRIFGKSVTEKVVTLKEIGRLIREGGEEPGSLIEFGLGGDVLGSVLEMIKTEQGEEGLVQIRKSSGLIIEDFKPLAPNRSKLLEKFI